MSWMDDEPVRGGYPDPRLLALSGIDRMKAGARRQMPPPPIHHLFGLTPVSASPASVTFSMPASPWLQTDAGLFFAGTAALVADAPLGGAVMAAVGPGQVIVTSDLSFNFLRPLNTQSGHVVARARPIDVGNTLGLAEAVIEDGQGRIVAHGTTRCFIITLPIESSDEELPEVDLLTYDTPDPYQRPLPEGSLRPDIYDRYTFVETIAMLARGEREPAPFAQLFGLHAMEADEGRFVCSMRSTPWLASPAGTLYGGVLAYFADCTLTGAFSSTLSTTQICAPLDLKVQFLRPVSPDGGLLRAEATVVHRGRTFAAAQAEIKNEQEKTVVLATSSAAIRSGRSWSSFVVADEAPEPPTVAPESP